MSTQTTHRHRTDPKDSRRSSSRPRQSTCPPCKQHTQSQHCYPHPPVQRCTWRMPSSPLQSTDQLHSSDTQWMRCPHCSRRGRIRRQRKACKTSSPHQSSARWHTARKPSQRCRRHPPYPLGMPGMRLWTAQPCSRQLSMTGTMLPGRYPGLSGRPHSLYKHSRQRRSICQRRT